MPVSLPNRGRNVYAVQERYPVILMPCSERAPVYDDPVGTPPSHSAILQDNQSRHVQPTSPGDVIWKQCMLGARDAQENRQRVRSNANRFVLFGVHIKYPCVLRAILLIYFCFDAIKRDVAMVRICGATIEGNRGTSASFMWKNCPRPTWIWFNELVGRVPWFFVRLSPAVMGFALYVTMFSGILFLLAVYLRSTACKHRPRSFFRALRICIVLPSLVIEMIMLFLHYYNIFVSVEFRAHVDKSGFIRPCIDAIFLATVYLLMVVLHVLCVWYVCEERTVEMPLIASPSSCNHLRCYGHDQELTEAPMPNYPHLVYPAKPRFRDPRVEPVDNGNMRCAHTAQLSTVVNGLSSSLTSQSSLNKDVENQNNNSIVRESRGDYVSI